LLLACFFCIFEQVKLHNTKNSMKTNHLGFPQKEVTVLTAELNILLANYHIYYQNLRGLHWNIRGRRFFDLHLKFEELYNDTLLKIDLLAERILTLGEKPLHTLEDYIKNNKLPIGKDISTDVASIELIQNCLMELLKMERIILEQASSINDEGTTAMMSDFIAEQEKTIWMLNAWLDEA